MFRLKVKIVSLTDKTDIFENFNQFNNPTELNTEMMSVLQEKNVFHSF